MPRARYAAERGEHYGLASRCYCHFTSPIRRYADLVVHRALRHALGLDAGGPLLAGRKLAAVAEICNSREKAAQDAERELVRRLGCLWLRERTGGVFRGVISGVSRFGLFVGLENMPMEGMVRVESLGGGRFVCDPDLQELRGLRHGRVYRLGQPVKVRLGAVRPESLEIDLFPIDFFPVGGPKRAKRRSGKAGKRSGRALHRPPPEVMKIKPAGRG
jgi:ribonuclease R